MNKALLLGLLVFGWCVRARATEVGSPDSGSPARAPDAVAGVNALVAPTTPALISAALTTKADGSQFRATIVPFRLADVAYVEVLTEAKLSFLTDTSTGLTRSSLGFSYNPFALRGKRGIAIVNRLNGSPLQDVDCRALPAPAPHDGCGRQQARKYCELAIKFAELGPKMAKAAETLATTRTAEQKALDALSTSEAVSGRQLVELEKQRKLRSDAEVALAEIDKALKTVQDDQEAIKKSDACLHERFAAEWHAINTTAIPMVTVTGYVESYPFGTTPDPKDTTSMTQADLEGWGGWGVEPSLSFHLSERVGLDLYGTLKHTRASGAPHTELAWYKGCGGTVSWLFHGFLKDEQLADSADYRKEGFLPGLVVGVSGQFIHCDGKEQCAKSRTQQWSVTPFFDIRVKPQLQLRFSAPLIRYESVNKDGNDIAPTFTLAAQVGSP